MAAVRLVYERDAQEASLLDRSDDELMRLAQAGSRNAFSTLVARHAARVVALCARFVDDPQLGRELAQDTWVLVWKGRDKYHEGGGFIPWLITVARNHCRNHARRRGTSERHARTLEWLSEEPKPDQIDDLLERERQHRVQRALAELPETMREALLLRYAEELPYEQMSSVVGTGESTLRSRVYHGLKMLKKKLEMDL